MVDSRPVMEQYNELLGILRRFTQHKMNMEEAIQVSCIINKLPPSWKDFKHTLKHLKDELTLVELGSHLRIEESLRTQDSDKPKGNNVAGPSVVNMLEHNNSSKYNDNKGKRKHHDDTKADPNKKSKATSYFVQDDDVAWWVNSGATIHVYKDRCWFKTYESLNDGSILHMRNESTALMHGRGLGLHPTSILWHAKLSHVHFKRMQDMSKDGLIPTFDMDTKKCKTCMLNKITKRPFQNVKRETEVLELIHNDLCDLHATPSLGNKKYLMTFIDDASRTDRGGEYMVTQYFQSVGIIHEATAPYTPQQNGISERKNRVLKEMVNSILSYSGLSERGIECIFIGYAEHSKAFRFYVVEPNDSVSINSIIESRDAIFDENRFSSVPRPSLRIPNGTKDIGGSVVSEEVTKEDVAFWKEAINDDIDSIMGNNTWVLADLPQDCKPLGCKWIFKRKLKVDGTIEKFKARLVIQGFKQKLGINYFDNYAPVARISTIRLGWGGIYEPTSGLHHAWK
ncbi:zinc finger, CCHC-type containing protein [Tanacetum coccineum]